MNITRFPVWIRWTALAVALWCVWGIAVHPFFTGRISATEKQHLDTERQTIAVKTEISQAPMILHRIDSCGRQLDACLAGFAGREDAGRLTSGLCALGGRHGLTRLRAEPALRSLLNAARPRVAPRTSQVRLDTMIVALSAQGGFFALGAWLDEVERRPDFRTWISCYWNRGDDEAGVGFEGKAIFLMADRLSPSDSSPMGGM